MPKLVLAGRVVIVADTVVTLTSVSALTLQARSYLNKLPDRFSEDDLVLITDPMLATGGTMMQVGKQAGSALNDHDRCCASMQPCTEVAHNSKPTSVTLL